MVRAVIYARFSSSAQREESIDTQIRECTKFALAKGMTIVGTYEDKAKSGRTSNRPGFQKMIRDSEKHIFDAVVLFTIDRFARNRLDAATYKAKLKQNGVTLYYAKQDLGDGPESVLFESLMEGYAEYYSASLSRSVKAGQQENALHAKFTGGAYPLGYCRGENGKYAVVPAEAEIVKFIFAEYAAGLSKREISKKLNERGYRTRKGVAYSKSSLDKILHNERYCGTYLYSGYRIPDAIPAIVSKELFDKVQIRLKDVHKVRSRYKAKDIYLLTPNVYCKHCGAPMYGESGHGRNGTLYTYYKCNSKKHDPNSCTKRQEKKDVLERFVIDLVAETILTDEMIEYIADRTVVMLQKRYTENPERVAIKKRLDELEIILKNSWKAVEQGCTYDAFMDRIRAHTKEQTDLQAELARLEFDDIPVSKEHIVYWLTMYKEKKVDSEAYDRFICGTLVNRVYLEDAENGTWVTVFCNVTDPLKEKEKEPNPSGSDLDSLVDSCRLYPKQVQLIPHRRLCAVGALLGP